MKEILFVKNIKNFGYRKITAIKEVGFAWGAEELNKDNFEIVKLPLTDLQIKETQNINKYHIDDKATKLIETANENLIKETAFEPLPKPIEMISLQEKEI